ncbi:hypothetical protein T11_17912, partial [Trichinella zimbabwensis]
MMPTDGTSLAIFLKYVFWYYILRQRCRLNITYRALWHHYHLWPAGLWGIFDRRYILSKNENRICTPERPFSVEGLAAYRRYWLQRIMDYMAQKGTKRQFDIV